MEASLGNDVNLDGGVTAGVVDGASVDLGDGHLEELSLSRRWADSGAPCQQSVSSCFGSEPGRLVYGRVAMVGAGQQRQRQQRQQQHHRTRSETQDGGVKI